MEQKKPFQRITISEMKALKEEQLLKKALEEATQKLQQEIHTQTEALAQRLVDEGYEVDSFEIAVDSRWVGSKFIVDLLVVQVGETLEFDLGGEEGGKGE